MPIGWCNKMQIKIHVSFYSLQNNLQYYQQAVYSLNTRTLFSSLNFILQVQNVATSILGMLIIMFRSVTVFNVICTHSEVYYYFTSEYVYNITV
jgi:hypothetical protein